MAKYSFSKMGYYFHYQNILFCFFEKGECVSPHQRKKSISKSPTKGNNLLTNDSGDFSPLISKHTKIKSQNSNELMSSSLVNFNNPIIYHLDENGVKDMSKLQTKIKQKISILFNMYGKFLTVLKKKTLIRIFFN